MELLNNNEAKIAVEDMAMYLRKVDSLLTSGTDMVNSVQLQPEATNAMPVLVSRALFLAFCEELESLA